MSFKTCGVLALAVLPVLFGCVACGLRPDGRQAAAASLAPDLAKSTSVAATAIPLPVGPQASKVSPPPVTLVMNSTVLPLVPPVGVPPRAPKRTDVDALMGDMRGSLAGTLLPDAPPLTHAALAAARTLMERAHAQPDTLQVVLVVDRSPKVQRLWVTVATPGSAALEPLGSVHVSTGKPGRKEHFRTPVGVFTNDAGILGYRAQGTYNENHIRGIGVRGMRVWDFGWQTTDDWRTPRALMAVRMEMHATDPSVLEPRLGSWDSEGCIRIPTRFNSFLDRSGLIDAKLWEAARDDRRFAALLPKHVTPSPLAGQTVVVVDTSEPNAAPSDPVKANLIAHPDTGGPEHDDAS